MNTLSKLELEMIESFRESLKIVKTGQDSKGAHYNDIGRLNQAAWIGEHSEWLLDRIEQLNEEVKRLGNRKTFLVTSNPTQDEMSNDGK